MAILRVIDVADHRVKKIARLHQEADVNPPLLDAIDQLVPAVSRMQRLEELLIKVLQRDPVLGLENSEDMAFTS